MAEEIKDIVNNVTEDTPLTVEDIWVPDIEAVNVGIAAGGE